jgi:hypothetical protein
MRRSVIALGDALRAVAALDPRDAEALGATMQMLGLTLGAEIRTRAAPSIGAWKPSATQTVSIAPIPAPVREPPRSTVTSDRPAIASRIRQVRKGTGTTAPPAWLDEPGEVLDTAPAIGPPPRKRALFDRVSRRGILSAAVATLVPEGDLDLDAILETVGQRRSLQRLPRLPMPTLRSGAQVLLDLSAGMDPFLEDQRQIIDALDDILANDRLDVRYFAGCPGRGVGTGARDEWIPWTPPARGVPVVVLTDLGIGGPVMDEDRATPAEWLRFAHRVQAEGHALIALVPYEASRWPAAVARDIVLIHWSERTTVGAVRRTMRHAWRRGR